MTFQKQKNVDYQRLTFKNWNIERQHTERLFPTADYPNPRADIEGIAGQIFDHIAQAQATDTRHFCSVQAWVEEARGMETLSNDERKSVSPATYGRIQLTDSISGARDRNAGNVLFKKISKEELGAKIDKQQPGLGQFILTALTQHQTKAKSSALMQEIVALPVKEYTRVDGARMEQIAENIISDFEKRNGHISPQVEIDVYLLVDTHLRGESSAFDAVPIDNGISFPDPELRHPAAGLSFFEAPTNNHWALEPQARMSRLPPRLADHFASQDLRGQVLPRMIEEHKELALLAQQDPTAHLSFNENQQKFWLVSTRIAQLGAREGKTYFEIALMKDKFEGIKSTDGRTFGHGALPTALARIYQAHCVGRPIDRINMKAMDADIQAEFQTINETFGTLEDGFSRLVPPDNQGLEQAITLYLEKTGL